MARMTMARRTNEAKPFTGWSMLAWIVGFFALIFAANGVLLYFAIGSFPGLEVESSYKVGQQYNDEIEAAAVQAALGWNVNVQATRTGDGARLTASFADKSRQPERGLTVTVRLQHPSDARRDQTVSLAETQPGVYEADVASVSTGHWILVVDATNGGERVFRSRNPLML